jgi:hypothetical protein
MAGYQKIPDKQPGWLFLKTIKRWPKIKNFTSVFSDYLRG